MGRLHCSMLSKRWENILWLKKINYGRKVTLWFPIVVHCFLTSKWQGLNFSLLSWANVPLKRLIANLVRNILDVFDTLWTHGDNHWRSSGSCHILLWQA